LPAFIYKACPVKLYRSVLVLAASVLTTSKVHMVIMLVLLVYVIKMN